MTEIDLITRCIVCKKKSNLTPRTINKKEFLICLKCIEKKKLKELQDNLNYFEKCLKE